MSTFKSRKFIRSIIILMAVAPTKQFTVPAILQLQEKGLLKLEGPIFKFILDYPRGDEITIHHRQEDLQHWKNVAGTTERNYSCLN